MAPSTIDEATKILTEYGDRARPLAGGTDLLVQLRGNRFELDCVVDLKAIPELNSIENSSEGLSFGAAVPCYRLYEDEEISRTYPGIIDAASLIGGIQIQSRAGIAGNLCNSSPSADGICPLIVHQAVAHIVGPNGERSVNVEDFCTGPGRNILQGGEIVTRISLPAPSGRFGAAYERFIPRNEMDIAVAAVAASVQLDDACENFVSAQIALAAVGPTPIFAEAAGNSLAGKVVSDESIENAAQLARDAATPISDMRGTIEQRKQLVYVLTKRMLHKSVSRAKE